MENIKHEIAVKLTESLTKSVTDYVQHFITHNLSSHIDSFLKEKFDDIVKELNNGTHEKPVKKIVPTRTVKSRPKKRTCEYITDLASNKTCKKTARVDENFCEAHYKFGNKSENVCDLVEKTEHLSLGDSCVETIAKGDVENTTEPDLTSLSQVTSSNIEVMSSNIE